MRYATCCTSSAASTSGRPPVRAVPLLIQILCSALRERLLMEQLDYSLLFRWLLQSWLNSVALYQIGWTRSGKPGITTAVLSNDRQQMLRPESCLATT